MCAIPNFICNKPLSPRKFTLEWSEKRQFLFRNIRCTSDHICFHRRDWNQCKAEVLTRFDLSAKIYRNWDRTHTVPFFQKMGETCPCACTFRFTFSGGVSSLSTSILFAGHVTGHVTYAFDLWSYQPRLNFQTKNNTRCAKFGVWKKPPSWRSERQKDNCETFRRKKRLSAFY